jgi:hypothetical protein
MKRCEGCGQEFTPKAWNNRPRLFCSRACYNRNRRGRLRKEKIEGRMTRVKGHPIAPPSGTVAVARVTLYDRIGPGPHPCHWCGVEVDWKTGLVPGALIADHLNWDRSDDSPENLVAACLPCNTNRQREVQNRALVPGELTVVWGGSPTRAIERVCDRCGETFLIPPAATKRGRGRFCSRDCMYARPKRSDT